MLTEIPSFTVIAEGSRSQGSVSFYSRCLILGIIEGEVLQQSLESITVGKTGWVRGAISAQGPVVIAGRVEGNVFSATRIQLLESATVTGTLVSPSIEIKPGALVESEIIMRWNRTEANPLDIAA